MTSGIASAATVDEHGSTWSGYDTAKAVAPVARGGISMFPATVRLTMEYKGTVLSVPGRLKSDGTAFRCHWRAAE
jgi:hypothetical protein